MHTASVFCDETGTGPRVNRRPTGTVRAYCYNSRCLSTPLLNVSKTQVSAEGLISSKPDRITGGQLRSIYSVNTSPRLYFGHTRI